MNKLLTIGYTETDAQARIDAFLAQSGTGLIDIRMSPRSRFRPQFNKLALATRYPDQYIWMPEFGNVNYRPEDRVNGIQIADPEAGLARVMHLINDIYEHPLMLLCACKDYETCHRKTVYELIMAAMPESEISNAR